MSGVRFESVEDRLRVTFEEMIPRLVEHVATVQVVETAPPVGRATTPSPVWTPNSVIGPPRRRWAVMGAVAVAASVAALAFVISRDDHAPGSAIGGDGTVAIGAELPEWYALLRAGVPPRFQYLALAYATPHDAFFVAFDPTDGKLLDIAAATAPGATSPQITCNVGPRPEDTLEPLAASAELWSRIQPKARFVYDQAVKGVIIKPESAEIEPREIRAFRLHKFDLWYFLIKEVSHVIQVVSKIFPEFHEPFPSALICGTAGYDAHDARVPVTYP